MRADAYIVTTAAGNAISLDEAKAVQYPADHRGVLYPVNKEDSARLDWLATHPHALVNALIGDLDSDVLCVGSLPGTGPLNIRGLIDRLRDA